MGRYDSSLTRVRPVFDELLAREPTGDGWLPALMAATPRSDPVLTEALRQDPGRLIPEVSSHGDGEGPLRRCFEHPVAPSAELLRWLICNPGALSWPKGATGEFGERTQDLRRRLMDGDADAGAQALAELDRVGPQGSARKWWAFEGVTKVDCWLETDRLVLFVEGKRTDKLSTDTTWLPARDQLTRNLDLVGSASPDKPGFVLLAVEEEINEPGDANLGAAAPHLGSEAAPILRGRYLGQLTWERICEVTGVDYESLPHEVGSP